MDVFRFRLHETLSGLFDERRDEKCSPPPPTASCHVRLTVPGRQRQVPIGTDVFWHFCPFVFYLPICLPFFILILFKYMLRFCVFKFVFSSSGFRFLFNLVLSYIFLEGGPNLVSFSDGQLDLGHFLFVFVSLHSSFVIFQLT